MADDWAREHLLDRREVGATTEGDWQLRGLGYVPQLVWLYGWMPQGWRQAHETKLALEAHGLLEAIYGEREDNA